jgi:predicted ArsR family transcriptional regulator
VPESNPTKVGDNRGRLLALLCARDSTTAELAEELGISPNGARGHLDRLEEEGLVEHRVVRRGVGKPAHVYRLTDRGSMRMSHAYLPLLSGLLTAADEEEGGAGGAEELLRRAGRALVRGHSRPQGSLRNRAEGAVALLAQMGGTGRLLDDGEHLWIEGGCCPLGALVVRHPLTCKAVEAMLSDYIGAPVREQCSKDDPPACRLVVGMEPIPAG